MTRSLRSPPWQPTAGDYARIFAEQNPWHLQGQMPRELAPPVERPLPKHLSRLLTTDQPRRYQLVLGPRRVGKSTAMYQTVRRLLADGVPANRLWWLRLDHPLLMQIPLDSLAQTVIRRVGATPNAPAFLFLDELTYATDWELWLKAFYDERRPIQIAATSSSTAALRSGREEAGVGRWEEQYLAPYLLNEYLALAQRPVDVHPEATLGETLERLATEARPPPDLANERRRFILTGGFPELLLDAAESGEDEASRLLRSQRTLRSDAVERAIYKDIPQVFGVDDPLMLERLLYTLAGQITGLLSPTSLCKELGISQPTFDRYLAYLERAFVVFTLPNYSGSEVKTQKRGRKLYFVDGAVRNAALQRGLAPLQDTREMGVLVENLAAAHLHALAQQAQVRLYHWRDHEDEVDLIFDQPAAPLAFEISSSPDHHRRGLSKLAERYSRFSDRCYLVAPGAPLKRAGLPGDPVGTLPVDLFLVAVGAQAEAALAERLRTSGSP